MPLHQFTFGKWCWFTCATYHMHTNPHIATHVHTYHECWSTVVSNFIFFTEFVSVFVMLLTCLRMIIECCQILWLNKFNKDCFCYWCKYLHTTVGLKWLFPVNYIIVLRAQILFFITIGYLAKRTVINN